MKGLFFFCFPFLFLFVSCDDPCYQHFSTQELQFLAYEKDQSIIMLDTNNVVHPMKQTGYRRELVESCGSFGCSGDHKEVYEIEYRSTLNTDWGFNLNLYARSCNGTTAYLSICSDDLSSYKPDRWIFDADPDSLKINYETIIVNGVTFYDVFELLGYYQDDKRVTMLFNEEAGIIQITFPTGKKMMLVP
jgi:hypothetical protein